MHLIQKKRQVRVLKTVTNVEPTEVGLSCHCEEAVAGPQERAKFDLKNNFFNEQKFPLTRMKKFIFNY